MAGTGDEPQEPQEPQGAVEDHAPRARLMQEVADQMDAIESDFGDGFEIGRVITIVEVTGPDGNVGIRVRAGQLPWVSLGMLEWAKKSLEAAVE